MRNNFKVKKLKESSEIYKRGMRYKVKFKGLKAQYFTKLALEEFRDMINKNLE